MRKLFLLVSIILFSFSCYSASITEKSFLGEWCGQWDESYSLCVTIDSIDANAEAKYKWVERIGGGFKKTRKKIRRLNLNTLQLENILFILDEKDLSKANAVGIFRVQTRSALLSKVITTK
jgi:hypothetical protein